MNFFVFLAYGHVMALNFATGMLLIDSLIVCSRKNMYFLYFLNFISFTRNLLKIEWCDYDVLDVDRISFGSELTRLRLTNYRFCSSTFD